MSDLDKTLLVEQLANYQIQQHDFLNNFQVIKGYLQLNMPEKALAYMDETLRGVAPQREIYRIAQKVLASVLLSFFTKLRLKGLLPDIYISPEFKDQGYWQENWREEYAGQFYGYTMECLRAIPEDINPNDLLAELELATVQRGFTCTYSLYKQGELYYHNDFSTERA